MFKEKNGGVGGNRGTKIMFFKYVKGGYVEYMLFSNKTQK